MDPEIQEIVSNYHNPTRILKGKPDTLYSLMEGLVGTYVFYIDLLLLSSSMKFPGYEI